MKNIILFTLSIFLIYSCKSVKNISLNTIKNKWEISYLNREVELKTSKNIYNTEDYQNIYIQSNYLIKEDNSDLLACKENLSIENNNVVSLTPFKKQKDYSQLIIEDSIKTNDSVKIYLKTRTDGVFRSLNCSVSDYKKDKIVFIIDGSEVSFNRNQIHKIENITTTKSLKINDKKKLTKKPKKELSNFAKVIIIISSLLVALGILIIVFISSFDLFGSGFYGF